MKIQYAPHCNLLLFPHVASAPLGFAAPLPLRERRGCVSSGDPMVRPVVAMDSSGNAHTTMLTMVSATPTDQGITDPGVYLPDIERVEAEWYEDVNIFVEWQHSVDANVEGYHIYISEEMFTSTDNATYLDKKKSANEMLITPETFPGLNNETTYYVAVTPYDREGVAKKTVEAIMVTPLSGAPAVGDGGQDDGQLSLESLLTTPNLIAAGMLLIIVLACMCVAASSASNRGDSTRVEARPATSDV